MRNSFRTLAVLAGMLVLPAFASAEDTWRLEKDKDGIQVYTRAVDGWSIREMRGVARIPGRLSCFVAVIDDIPAIHELNEMVSTSSIPHRDSDTQYQLYSTIKMPWPLSDRDVLNLRTIVQDGNTLAVTITV